MESRHSTSFQRDTTAGSSRDTSNRSRPLDLAQPMNVPNYGSSTDLDRRARMEADKNSQSSSKGLAAREMYNRIQEKIANLPPYNKAETENFIQRYRSKWKPDTEFDGFY